MKLIVGLGNPGDEYSYTRHNLGFLAIDNFADRHGFSLNKKKKKTQYSEFVINGSKLIFIKPQTFMNSSGEAVLYIASFLKIPIDDIIVICDDINLDFGKIRIRPSGSAGGHNGLKSLIGCLNSDNFTRIRVGVGNNYKDGKDLKDYVLKKFSKDESKKLPELLDFVTDALKIIITDSTERAMNEFNGKTCFSC